MDQAAHEPCKKQAKMVSDGLPGAAGPAEGQQLNRPAQTVEAALTPATSWGGDQSGTAGPADDVSAQYAPPFEFTSDMLFLLALGPTTPLRRAFPAVPFLSALGRTPLVIWFSRVKEGCSRDAAGAWRCEGGPTTVLYHELTVIALLRRRTLFVPAIYATSVRSVRIARHYYGMPKYPTSMGLQVVGQRFEAHDLGGPDGARRSFVRARLRGSGTGLARLLSRFGPLRVWPVQFPAGTEVRGAIQATPRLYLAHVHAGQLSLAEAWLPEAIPFLPAGVYVPDLRMRLLPPERPLPAR
jgi:hypothetical protein